MTLEDAESGRREQLIARHTVIQTWTNIISVAFSIVTAIALAVLAYFQWQVSERGFAAGLRAVELEYAKARLTYSVDRISSENPEFTELQSRNRGMSLTPMIATMAVEIGGEASSIQIRPKQYFSVTRIVQYGEGVDNEQTGCVLSALYYYEFYSTNREFYAPSFWRSPPYSPYFENKVGEALIIEPTDTEIDFVYIDVFDKRRTDSLLLSAGGTILINRDELSNADLPVADVWVEGGRVHVVVVGDEPTGQRACDAILYNSSERPLQPRFRRSE